ncbi:hypothetical protein SBADM41S_10020 [Streptomyces badius]
MTAYYTQKLSWRDCGVEGFECTTMKAPRDYDKPDDGDIELAVSRKKATGPGKRIGSLLVNPGGPGGSAIGYLQGYAALGYPAPVRARYDMVAIDPRGVARSEPVECLTGKEIDTFTQVDQTPDDDAEVRKLTAAFEKFAAGCEAGVGEILPYVSTVDTARDMDVLRALLGDEKLHYVGASYGTFLGATYADLFPQAAGRLVLDGAMDPSLKAIDMNRSQTAGSRGPSSPSPPPGCRHCARLSSPAALICRMCALLLSTGGGPAGSLSGRTKKPGVGANRSEGGAPLLSLLHQGLHTARARAASAARPVSCLSAPAGRARRRTACSGLSEKTLRD